MYWTLVGIFLGINKWAIGKILAALLVFVAASLATLESLLDDEIDLQRRLLDQGLLLRRIPGPTIRSTCLILLFTMAIDLGGAELSYVCGGYLTCLIHLEAWLYRIDLW